MSARRLLVSIHDVGPGFSDQVDRLADRLEGLLGGPRFAMLVVPDHWGVNPLEPNAAYRAKLREWADRGVEMFVHGWFHKDLSQHEGLANFKAKHMTAGEGEFLGLSHDEALRRMRDGKALVEDTIGREAAGFIAPAWLYGDGARAALSEVGFRLAEDHFRVWRPADDAVLAKGPVITWASRSSMRTASSLFFAGLARTGLQPLNTVRIAVHPGDTTKQSILRDIDRTVGAFARRRPVGRYADLDANAAN
ncbi:MAG: DUF2334 domain-containing protein [Tsuneonella suprasediminis]|uniref:DUF2334 domain-containing protein n=1 Tax=Tsuneonella suprasediminis TaxID=2306996 RepID=A0A419R1J3_9SPHN|nr:polysaccharide deacetylase family protein [Tsuneonella suprasediminis]RJX67826.1 DUF2334 domain-containing protein [Tsuneonella suprasediminis]UBS33220.1 polysaccharide deacetylase family protein [Altererythrobacter sp. N1]